MKKTMKKTRPLKTTLKDRGAIYGDFTDNAKIAQEIKDSLRSGGSWALMNPAQREAVDVIASKLSRIVTGDPNYKDNAHDIQGYAKLYEDRCE